MKTRDKTYITAQGYIDIVEKEAREIELLESLLAEKHRKIESTLMKLRTYKKRNIVKQVSKYRYEVIRGDYE